MSDRPLICVAIPAYNRPGELAMLLDSIAGETANDTFADFEVLVVEDCSPKAREIADAVARARERHPKLRLRFAANEKNLGYDGNLRHVLELSQGVFTFFMGDDDLLRPGALARVAKVLREEPNLGVLIRAYEMVDFDTGARLQLFRYFAEDRFFPAGAETIRTFFRRSVSVAGYTVHTDSARSVATDRYDGTLLYQLHLSARVLQHRDGYFVSDVLTAMRKNDEQRHFFGTAAAEKGKFAPGALTREHSLEFMRGMFRIAREEEEATGLPIYQGIVDDLGNYSYSFLRLHAHDKRSFARYAAALARMGLWKNRYFWGYTAALSVVPAPALDRGIAWLKQVLPATPRLGKLYQGEAARPQAEAVASPAEQRLRLLIAGAFVSELHEEAWSSALEQLGHSVVRFKWGERLLGPLGRLENKLLEGPSIRALNRELLARALAEKPDAVILYRGTHVLPATLRRIKQRLPGTLLVTFNNDDPFSERKDPLLFRHYLRALPLADVNLVYRDRNLEQVRRAGGRNVHLVRSYYLPEKDRPPQLTDEERARLACDVLFAGHYEADGRDRFLRALAEAGIDLRVVGPEWERAPAGLRDLLHPLPAERGQEYVKRVAAAKIALCFLSGLNGDTYTRRCFEIPAIGTFLLCQRTPDVETLLIPGVEFDTFATPEELLAKVRSWLADDAGRGKVAAAGQAKVRAAGHDVLSRMREVESIIRQYRRAPGGLQ